MSDNDTKTIYEFIKKHESELSDSEKHIFEKLGYVVKISELRNEMDKLFNELNNLSAEENKEIKK